ncbi:MULTISPECIES: hypothetical protein [unclassified Lysinibacillus]|uniref:hypothetical protein n=1 Tax=unclassified Lysinibacillus TaxID=2636778 RepID=UPI001D178835|nr:hypothetical protein [Lysinibacillus sp. CD3-6]UED82381.1 hypothetical protein FH508_0010915 [Lysinibacillus sp. CD3-6]
MFECLLLRGGDFISTRRLHIWQPVTCLQRAQIVNAQLNYSDRGLYLTLTDINGSEVDIIYDKISPIQDFVWSFRYAGEIPRSDLFPLVNESIEQNPPTNPCAEWFYKMSNSDYIEWFDQLPWIGSKEIPNVEHHIYCYNDGIFEVISDYEPRFVIK